MDVHFKLTTPVQLLFHEQAKSIIALQELQNEVSSLLEFKNALLETFPHLQSKISAGSSIAPSAEKQQQQLEGCSGPTRRCSRAQSTSTNNEETLSDEIPSSWNTGSISRSTRKSRKSPEGSSSTTSNVSDSGFGTSNDLKDSSVHLLPNLSSSSSAQKQYDWTNQSNNLLADHLLGASRNAPEDELLYLLDVIHRKTVRLRKEDVDAKEDDEARALKTPSHHGLPPHHQSSSSRFTRNVPPSLGAVPPAPQSGPPVLGAISESEENVPSSFSQTPISIRDTKNNVRKMFPLQQQQIQQSHLEEEILALRKERRTLIDKIIELESKALSHQDTTSTVSRKEDENGIVHSVQIRTSSSVEDIVSSGSNNGNNSVNIEIKRVPSGASVVNLLDAPSTTISRTSKVSPQLNKVLLSSPVGSPLVQKSKSVDNLQKNSSYPSSRETICSSELNVSKIGKRDKLDLKDICSMPAVIHLRDFMDKKAPKGVKPQITREKVRKVLSINNVIELQRQLLTTVMEKEVYKTQLERVSEGWESKIKEFEKKNEFLQASLSHLKTENESLKSQIQLKDSEIEGTKSLLKSATKLSSLKRREESDLADDNYIRYKSEPRVQFDLARNRGTSTTILSQQNLPLTRGKMVSQLPSNARQQLEEMASNHHLPIPKQPKPPDSGRKMPSTVGNQKRKEPIGKPNELLPGNTKLDECSLRSMDRETMANVIARLLTNSTYRQSTTRPTVGETAVPTGGIKGGSSWLHAEANNGLDEMIQKSHTLQQDSLNSTTGDLGEPTAARGIQPDSLLDFSDEEILVKKSGVREERRGEEFYDSISLPEETKNPTEGDGGRRKTKRLIMPYSDSYSSNTSVITTSQEEEEDEEDSFDHKVDKKSNNELTLEIQSFKDDPYPKNSQISNPPSSVAKVPMAEKLKRKFLGW